MWPIINDNVTFQAFRTLMAKRHYSLDDLVALFHGKLDDNRDFFARILKGEHAYRDVVIPYKSVLKFYYDELRAENIKKQLFA